MQQKSAIRTFHGSAYFRAAILIVDTVLPSTESAHAHPPPSSLILARPSRCLETTEQVTTAIQIWLFTRVSLIDHVENEENGRRVERLL